jgi:hypothetical protein
MEGGPCVIDLCAACRVSVHLMYRVSSSYARGVSCIYPRCDYRSAMLAVSSVSAASNQVLMDVCGGPNKARQQEEQY